MTTSPILHMSGRYARASPARGIIRAKSEHCRDSNQRPASAQRLGFEVGISSWHGPCRRKNLVQVQVVLYHSLTAKALTCANISIVRIMRAQLRIGAQTHDLFTQTFDIIQLEIQGCIAPYLAECGDVICDDRGPRERRL